MKTWPLLFIIILLSACRHKQNQPLLKTDSIAGKKQQNQSLKTNLLGDWEPAEMAATIDTENKADFPDIHLEAKISFLRDGTFKKHDVYYTEGNQQKKEPGYTSKYKINGDTLFIYEPVIKHWYALHATANTKDRLNIAPSKGYSHLDDIYVFGKVQNNSRVN